MTDDAQRLEVDHSDIVVWRAGRKGEFAIPLRQYAGASGANLEPLHGLPSCFARASNASCGVRWAEISAPEKKHAISADAIECTFIR
jgi:hypothetical protein